MRIVIDTNVLLQIIPRLSPFRKIFDALLTQEITMVVSTDVLLEYEEILERELNPEIAKNVIRLIETLPNAEKQEIFYKWNLIDKDLDDNKFSDTAINGAADYLITNDKHFDILKDIPFPKVSVVSPYQFMQLLPTI